jgi:molybdopterin-guanine dinucleotide biosynthesis protein A
MDSPKGLLNYHATIWIIEQISRYKYVQNPKVYIGLGFNYKLYLEAIPWFTEALKNFYLFDGVEVRVVINKQPEFGTFSTLQTVLNKIDKTTNVLVQPIDVPLANRQSLETIINKKNNVIIPRCDSKNDHPVKLNPEFWKKLLQIDKSSTKARLDLQIKNLDASTISYVNVSDNTVYQNINTVEEWNLYLKTCNF